MNSKSSRGTVPLREEFFFSLKSKSSRSTVPLRCSSSPPSSGTPVRKEKGKRWRTQITKTTESSSQKAVRETDGEVLLHPKLTYGNIEFSPELENADVSLE